MVPSWDVGPSAPTLFDAMAAAGRSSGAVFGDHHLVGVTGAADANFLWPPDKGADDVALDVLGYARDSATAAALVDVLHSGAELVVAQLNEPDTVAHIFGPDSPEALHRYRRADDHLATVIESISGEWDEWAVIVVSDHSQETVTEVAPVDLRAAARRGGWAGLVVDDGAGAVAGGKMARDASWMMEVPGVEGIQRLGEETVLAWATAGRYFASEEVPVRGVHGSPRTTGQIAVVTGGHPGAERLGTAITHRQPSGTSWAPAAAELLDLPFFPDRSPA